jgi:hypothetical protein
MTDDVMPWSRQAAEVLHYAIADPSMRRASDTMRALVDEHGHEVVCQVMLAWIDTVNHRYLHAPSGTAVHLFFIQPGTRAAAGADDVHPDVAWAGQVIAARLADDEDSFVALMMAVPDDRAWTDRVYAVLDCLSTTVRGILRRGVGSPHLN